MFKRKRNKKADVTKNNDNHVDYDYYPENFEEVVDNYDNNYQTNNQNINEEVYDQNAVNYNNDYDQNNSSNVNNFDEYNQRIAYYNQFEDYNIPEEPNPITEEQSVDNNTNHYNNVPQDGGNIAYDDSVVNQFNSNIENETEPNETNSINEEFNNDNHNVESEDEVMNNNFKDNRREAKPVGAAPQKKSIKKDIEKMIQSISGLEKTIAENANVVPELNTDNLENLISNNLSELSTKIISTLDNLIDRVNSNITLNAKNSEVTLQLIRVMDDLANTVEMNEEEIKAVVSEEIDTKLKSFQEHMEKQNELAFQNVISRISDKLDKRFDRFDASFSSFDNEFEKISLTLTKSFTKEIEKFNKKFSNDIEKINNDLTINSSLTFEKVNKILEDSRKRNQEVMENIVEKFQNFEEEFRNNSLEEYDELSLSDTDIRVLKWLLSKEYAIQKDITKSSMLSSLNFLANLNIIEFGWNDHIDELPVMAYWISKEKGNRIRTLLGRWEYSKFGQEVTTTNNENSNSNIENNNVVELEEASTRTKKKTEENKKETKKEATSNRTGSLSSRSNKN